MTYPRLLQNMARLSVWRGVPVATLTAVLCGGCPGPSGAAVSIDAGGDSAASRASKVVNNGFVMAGPWAGSGFTATDPGAATITPSCGAASCTPPFTGNEFCMQGTVTGRPDYTGFAMLGWNVSQADGGAAGTWAVPATGGITVTVLDNPTNVALRVQLQGTDPHSSTDRWCAPLTNGKPLAWSDFKTNCYAGGTPQNALTPGTPIQQASILVPGLLTDLPFDVCLLDVEFQP